MLYFMTGPKSVSSLLMLACVKIDLCNNYCGELIDPEDSQYTWLGHLYEGPGIAPKDTACDIQLPLSTNSLHEMYNYKTSRQWRIQGGLKVSIETPFGPLFQ